MVSDDLIIEKTKICSKTLKKWKKQMKFIEKIDSINVDRALKEMLFTDKSQIECFVFLVKDLNYFCTFSEVKKHINISRYLYKVVKDYITEELSKENNKK